MGCYIDCRKLKTIKIPVDRSFDGEVKVELEGYGSISLAGNTGRDSLWWFLKNWEIWGRLRTIYSSTKKGSACLDWNPYGRKLLGGFEQTGNLRVSSFSDVIPLYDYSEKNDLPICPFINRNIVFIFSNIKKSFKKIDRVFNELSGYMRWTFFERYENYGKDYDGTSSFEMHGDSELICVVDFSKVKIFEKYEILDNKVVATLNKAFSKLYSVQVKYFGKNDWDVVPYLLYEDSGKIYYSLVKYDSPLDTIDEFAKSRRKVVFSYVIDFEANAVVTKSYYDDFDYKTLVSLESSKQEVARAVHYALRVISLVDFSIKSIKFRFGINSGEFNNGIVKESESEQGSLDLVVAYSYRNRSGRL